MMRSVFRLFAALSGALLLVALAVVPASAEPGPDEVVQGELFLDCASLDQEEWEYAVDNGYCEEPEGDATPEDVRWGPCGYSYLYIYDEGYSQARWDYGYGSILGATISHDLEISWTNHDTQVSDTFWDDVRGFPTPAYSSFYERSTGRGEVTTSMMGTVTLAWGGNCQVEVPTARAEIT